MAAGGEASTLKAGGDGETLSPRDRALLDSYSGGTTRTALAKEHGISLGRVCQITSAPASIAYLARKAGSTKTLLYAKAGEELLARMDWGGMKLGDLLAIWKAAMPQEINVNLAVAEAARIVAERRGLTPEQTATVVELASRRKVA